jgi:hypothetical protein
MRRVMVAPAPAWISAGVSLVLAAGLYAASVALGYDTTAFGSGDEAVARYTAGFLAAVVGAVGLTLLAGALVLGQVAPLGWAIGLLLAGWVGTLAGAGPVLQVDFVVAGAGHLVVAELAFWSVGSRRRGGPAVAPAGPTARWAIELLGTLAVSVVIGWLLVPLVVGAPGGTAVDLAAVAAVLGLGVAVLLLARDSKPSSTQ